MGMVADNEKIVAARNAISGESADEGAAYAGLAKEFQEAGAAFIEALAGANGALATFEGETKDVLVNEKIGTAEKENTLAYFVEKQIPDLIMGLGKLLEGNRSTIESADHQLAQAISGNGQNGGQG